MCKLSFYLRVREVIVQIVNIHEAKTHFTQLITQALKGGKALVKLTPCSEERPKRQGGQLRGMINIASNFDDPLPDSFLKNFYGDENH